MADGSQTSIPFRQSFLPMTPGGFAHLIFSDSSGGALKLFMQRTERSDNSQCVQQTNYIGYEDIEVEDKMDDITFMAYIRTLYKSEI
jgi:hypothetical protein